jgi:type IV pilus assembly protein PilV
MDRSLGSRQLGFNLLEVLVAMVIVMVGLLGLAGMQARAHVAELESYQRAQALVLLYDMMDRLNNNRYTAACFAFTTDAAAGTPYAGTTAGGGHISTPACAVSSTAYNTLANNSISDWDSLLAGAAEKSGTTQIGAMVGARGCVTYDSTTEFIDAHTGLNISGTGEYTIAVSWQGMSDTFAPAVACGKDLYGAETRRRTVWATTRLGTLVAR